MKSMLLVFAHPDDESFTCGGTVPKYVKAGWRVTLLCATHGESGSRGTVGPLSDEELGALRTRELEAAAAILGIADVRFLDYKDATLTNLHPGELEDAVHRTMESVTPDVVITFEPKGISNHPDHMKLTLSTTYAFQKYAKDLLGEPKVGRRAQAYFRRTLAQTQSKTLEPKLYYACMPESIAGYFLRLGLIPRESFGRPWEGIPDKFITTIIDTSRYKKTKVRALRAHESQKDDVDRFLSLDPHPLTIQEYFILRMQGVCEVFMGKTDRVANRL